MNNSLITAKLPCHIRNLYTIPKLENLIHWPAEDYNFTLSPPPLKWKLHFYKRKPTNEKENKNKNKPKQWQQQHKLESTHQQTGQQ